MRPIKLELQAFGPFVEKQTVDFERLAKDGMFLIKGDTGSGKTTIFDAMTFALYGGSSGNAENVRGGRNDLEEWRCTQAPDDLDTFVSFTFASGGKTCYFTRGLRMKRKNLSAYYEAGEELDDGVRVPFFENPKEKLLNAKAEALIGLTKEQFRQVVLLPQGQFEQFLLAGSSSKEAILTQIFGTERWARYAENFYNAALAEKKALDAIKEGVTRSLDDEGLPDLEALEAKIGGLKKELAAAEEAHKAFDAAAKQKKLKEDIALFERFRSLHELEAAKKALDEARESVERTRAALREAEKAEDLRAPITEAESAEKELLTRERELGGAEKALSAARENADAARNKAETYEKRSPVEENNKKIGALSGKREVYAAYGGFAEAELKAKAAYEKANAAAEQASKTYGDAARSAKDAKDAYDAAAAVAKDYRDRYYAGIYGAIAAELAEGAPCPVCGSTAHPKPAEKAPDAVEKAALEAKEAAAEQARKHWDRSEAAREKAERIKKEADAALDEKKDAYRTAHESRKSAAAQLAEGIADLAALDRAIAALQTANGRFSEELKRLREAADGARKTLTEAETGVRTAAAELEKARKKADEARQTLARLLEEKGFADVQAAKALLRSQAERAEMQKSVTEHDTKTEENRRKLAEKQNELSGSVEPDSGRFEERQAEIDAEADEYRERHTSLSRDIERLSERLGALRADQAAYKEQIGQAEEDLAFARKLQGVTGVGLSRYVLAVMFGQVIAEANRMLAKVHEGRYRLFRTSEKGAGNKRGLELKVFDSRSPDRQEGRGVSMLSGGEKFLVSLALSIGMSTVAQTSGVRIEALFIDEGFGTLDDNSIRDAMDVLESVRKSNGMIGIISHVPVLEGAIPTQVEVVKRKEGSSIRPV